MRFGILGPLEVAVGDGPIDIGGPRQRALLAMLLVQANRVVSADRLIDGLWPEQAPRRAAAGLQVLVSNLRRALEPDRPARQAAVVLVTKPPGYLLVVDESDLDAGRFERLLAAGQRLLAEGRPAAAQPALEDALSLWRGPALAEFAFDDFARSEAARLQELRTVALEERVQVDLQLGRHGAAVAAVEHLLDEYPLRERLWALLMTAYYRSGRQADALRAFQQARRRLGDELGIDPGPALQQHESDVLAQAPSLDWHPPAEEPVEAAPRPVALAPVAGAVRGALVGRGDEMRRLMGALDQATAGRGRVVLVSGDPGVGKTRLVEELTTAAQGLGALVAWGRCHPGDGAPPFWPWVEALRQVVGVEPPEAGPESAAVAQLVPELRDGGPGLSQPAADPLHARFSLCHDLSGYLRRLAGPRCLVVTLDDLHWADLPSLELLSILASTLDGARLLVVGTYRDVDVDADHPLTDTMATLARQTFLERVGVKGISPEESGRFIAEAMGAEPTPELAAAVHARTDGNPFFMTELLRLLESEGPVATTDHQAALQSPVPVGVRDVISQRVAQFPAAARTVLTAAAVAGREFDQRLLDAASGVGEDESLAALELALSRGILTESPDAVGRFRFSHALIRETIYAGISGLRRARLHARVGEALEQHPSAADGQRVDELAHHFWNAAPAAGVAKAFRYSTAAADAAVAQLAYERAQEQLGRALGLVGSLPEPERAAAELGVLARLGTMLAATRGQAAPEVEAAFSRARELCLEAGNTRDAVTALWGFFYSSYVRGRIDDARAIAATMLALAEDGSVTGMALAGELAMGIVSFHGGQLADARAHLEAGTKLADGAAEAALVSMFQVDPRVYARCFHSLALALVGEPGEAGDAAREARRLAADGAHPFTMATAAMFGAWLAFLQEDAGSAGEHAAATITLCEEHGFTLLAAAATAFEGWALARREQAEAGAGAVRAATGLAAMRGGGASGQPLFIALEAEVEYLAGRPGPALDLVDAAVAGGAVGVGGHYFDAALHRLRAEILLGAFPERSAEAAEGLRRSMAVAASQGAVSLERRAAAALATL